MSSKLLKLSLAFVLCFVGLFTFSSCGVSEKWEEKIEVAAAKEEYYTYNELMKKLGDPVLNLTVSESGVVTWIKGYDNMDDANKALENGKTLKQLSVTFVKGNATSADFELLEQEEDK